MSSPILINDTVLPVEVTNYQWGIADLDGAEGTGRSESTGVVFRDPIAKVRTLTIELGPSSVDAMATMLQLVNEPFVDITYLDALDGKWRTDNFYVADRGVQSLTWDSDLIPGESNDFSKITWGPCSMEFVGEGNPIDEE